MENGVETVQGSNSGENKATEERVLEESIAERVLGVFHISKGSEGDEVFEEATEQLQEQVVSPDTQDAAADEDGNVQVVHDSRVEADDGTFSVENEVETFEEATEQLQEQIVITDTQDGAVNEEGTARSVLDSLEEAGDGNHSVTKTENVDETMGVPAEIENHEQEMTSVVEVGMESLQDGECGDKNLAINGDNEGGTGRVAEMDELNGLVSSYAKMSNNDGNEETMEVYDSSEWRARVGELDSSDGGEISNHSSIEEAPVVNDMTEMEAVMDELNGLLSSGWKEEISNGGADEETVVMHDVAEKGADLYELNGLVSSGRKELYNDSGNEETAGANNVAEKGVDISEFSGLVCNGGKEISNDGANEEMAVVNDVAGHGADMSEFSGLVSSGGKEISNDGANEEMVWVNDVATSEADIGTSNVLVSSGGKEISNDGANKETTVNNVAEKRADVDELDLLVDSGSRETCTDGTNEEALTVLDADKAIKESDTLTVLDADKAIKESDTCDDWVDGKIHEKSENGYADKKVSKDVNSFLQDEVNEKILHHRDQGEDLKNENGDAEHQDEKTSSDEKDVQSGLYARHQDDNCKEIKCLADMDSGRGGNNGKEPNHVSGAENNKSSLPQHFEENICQVSRNHAIPEESEKKEIRHKEENQNIRGNRERETRPTNEAGSASRKSSNPAPIPAHPAGLGRAAPLLEPASRLVQQPRANGAVSQVQAQPADEPTNGETEENDETREKLQMIRVKFLRLAHRLGQTPHNVVVAQVLYRLGLAEQIRGRNRGRAGAFSFDRASAMAEQLEAAGQEPLDFACTLMVLGKTGVGKSATINSIFDEIKFGTDAFQFGTKKVQDVVGTVQGIKVRVIDTPGLLPSWSDQRQNMKILHSVKRFIKKTPPDIVLYLDRLDMQSRDFSDMPLLLTITDIFGPSIWFNAIVVLTHAASAPPDGPNGVASSYDMFVTQRSHVVQQVIRQAAGDMRLMNPVSLVENHSACRTNRAGQRVLPNGQVWKPHLLLLSFASKILAEANALLKLQDSPPGKPFVTRSRSPPLPFLLSSLLQSRPQLKLPEEQFGEDEALEDDLDELSDSDIESEYDELPPFRRLTKAQLAKLTKDQRKAYYDELEYREKLFMKKQLKEERKQRKQMKKMAASAKDIPAPGDYGENLEDESSSAASVPVPMPDLALPASFDSDNPTHRYRYLDTSNQWLVRPVLETHGWDHDVGYEGINVERLFMVKDSIPFSFSGQVTKDKKDANLQMEVASSIKHGKGKATSLGFDMQTVGKDMSYTLRSETGFSNRKHNKATAGLSVTLLGDALSAGLKLEDKLIVNKCFRVVMTGGAMAGRGDVAYGGSLEATLKDKDYPLGRSLSTLGLSVMDWHGDLAIGCNIQSQIPVGRHTNMIARANLNNRGAGQVSIRMHSSEQLQIALIALLPICRKIFGGYSPQLQFGQW